MSKMPWESFSADIQPIETADGFLSFEVKSEKPITLLVHGLTTGNHELELFKEKISSGEYQQVLYNLSTEGRISHLIFYVNPGEAFNGEVYFKGLTTKSLEGEGEVLSVFPNPTAGDLLIRLPHKNFTHVLLYDESGNVILTKTPDGLRSLKLDLAGKKAGLYVLKARSSNELLTTKVVVKH
jgi:hypothetical protein